MAAEPRRKIEAVDLLKTYDGKANVLEGVNLDVNEGEFFILVGPSGCGKSTLLRIIAGLETVSSGELRIDGRRANELAPRDRDLTMVFQSYALYPHLTVRDNILFGLDVKKVPKDERARRLEESAELLGLTELLGRKPRELSGGQRQRVALARSVCSRASICLMDEPLSNLDAKLRAQMRVEIRRLQRRLGLTVVYVTHDQVEAMTMGDRIAVLQGGRIQQVGTPLELYNAPANTFVAGFIGSPQMNMADAQVVGNELVLNGELRLPLDEGRDVLPLGDRWRVGVRPESLRCAGAGEQTGGANFTAHVLATEMLGNETRLEFAVGKGVFCARWQGQHSFGGDQVKVAVDIADLHFFDERSGELLLPAAVPAGAEQGLV
jgi:sn-glycerol 3-phosphate transport system ATP-binding protein